MLHQSVLFYKVFYMSFCVDCFSQWHIFRNIFHKSIIFLEFIILYSIPPRHAQLCNIHFASIVNGVNSLKEKNLLLKKQILFF